MFMSIKSTINTYHCLNSIDKLQFQKIFIRMI
jgi:hypothetical protein